MASPKRGVGFLTELKSWHTENFQPASSRNFNTTALYGLKVTSSTSGRLVCDFPVTKRAQNLSGCLHGGCIGRQRSGVLRIELSRTIIPPPLLSVCLTAATLFDVVTSGALVSVAPHGGVSVHMSIDYFRPTPGGDVCEVDAKITKLGRALAFSEVVIKNKTTGQITARGTDIKFVPAMQPSDSQGKGPIGTPMQSASPAAAIAFVSDLVSAYDDDFDPEATSNFEATALYGLKDISATEGHVVCTLPVRPPVENIYHTLHGGCIGAPTQRVFLSWLCIACARFIVIWHISQAMTVHVIHCCMMGLHCCVPSWSV